MLTPVIFINWGVLSCFLLNGFLRIKNSSKNKSTNLKNKEKPSSIDPTKELEIIQSKLSDLEDKIEKQEKTIKKILDLM